MVNKLTTNSGGEINRNNSKSAVEASEVSYFHQLKPVTLHEEKDP